MNAQDVSEAGFRHFERWCGREGRDSLPAPPATVVAWVASSSLAPGSIRSYLRGIRVHHEEAGHPDPTQDPGVRAALASREAERRRRYRRRPEPAPPPAPRPRGLDSLRELLSLARDLPEVRAQLLLAYGGGLHAPELLGLRRSQLRFEPQGLIVEGLSRGPVVIRAGRHEATDPVAAVDARLASLERSEDDEPPVFARSLDRWLRAVPGSSPNRLTTRNLSTALAGDAEAAGASPAALARHLRRRGDLRTRFADALTRRVGL